MSWSNTSAENLSNSLHVPGIFEDRTVDQSLRLSSETQGRMFAIVVGDRDGLCTYVPEEADPEGFFVERTTCFDDGNEFGRVSMSIAVVLFRETAAAILEKFTI